MNPICKGNELLSESGNRLLAIITTDIPNLIAIIYEGELKIKYPSGNSDAWTVTPARSADDFFPVIADIFDSSRELTGVGVTSLLHKVPQGEFDLAEWFDIIGLDRSGIEHIQIGDNRQRRQ